MNYGLFPIMGSAGFISSTVILPGSSATPATAELAVPVCWEHAVSARGRANQSAYPKGPKDLIIIYLGYG